MAAWRSWIITFGLFLFLFNPHIHAETVDAPPPQPEEIISPNVEPVTPAEHTYRLGDVITYQVRIHWPKFQEGIRLDSPEVTTENLEFSGVSQETGGEGSPSEEAGEVNQILNFKFQAQKPGPAKVNRFPLRWTYGQGAATTSVTIPALELTIKNRPFALLTNPFLVIATGVLLSITSLGAFLLIRARNKKREVSSIPSVNVLEESALEELEKVKTKWENESGEPDFLNHLNRIFYHYLDQKLGWNPAKGSYNGVQKRVEEKWSKKDASELKELIDRFEYIRFSAGEKDRLAAAKLCDSVSSFIERRKIS